MAVTMKNAIFWDGMLHHVALVRTDILEECSASIRVTIISELGMILVTQMMEALCSSEASVLTRASQKMAFFYILNFKFLDSK
jgi:hypothetical protein